MYSPKNEIQLKYLEKNCLKNNLYKVINLQNNCYNQTKNGV